MKSNFDFLNRYWPALAQIGATAETYVYSDPNACIYKLGMFAERLVQEILVFEHIAEPAVDNTHANRIRILKRAGLLPHEIDNTLYVLRKTRNSAVHIGTDSVDEAKTLLSLTYNLAVWFMETYGDWGYIAPEFVMPSETTHEDLESVIAEQERKIEELTKQLAVVKTAASGKTQKERARRSESVSAMMNWNEAQTRCLIDEQLRLSGWEADTQNLRYSKGTRPVKGRNIAISEWPTNSAFYKNGYMLFADYLLEWLEIAKGRLAHATYGAYQGLLKSTIVPYFRKKKLTLRELEARHLQMFYSEMLRRVTPNTVIHYHAVIHSALKYAVKTDMLIQNVADKVDRPRKNSFQPVFLSADEMQKMFEALRGTKLELPVLVAAFYGLRRGEVVGLKWDAIDFEQGTISVKRTVTSTIIDGKYQEFEQQSAKTKSSLRTLPLIGSFREYFMQVKEAQELNKQVCGNCYNYEYDGFVFVDELGERMRVEYLTNAFPKFLESHGLRRMRFHDLRHSCASLLLANGVPLKHIQEWLGHSDFTTTANIYAHLDYKSKITSAQAMETGLALPEGGDFSSRWSSISAGENS